MTDTTIHDQEPILTVQFRLDGTEDAFVQPYLANHDDEEATAISKLSDEESELLAKLEVGIEEAMEGFNDIGYPLFQIKAKKLYRGTHCTFAAYCRDKFHISRVHADRLTNAYKTQELLKKEPIGSVSIPQTESAMRSLNGLNEAEKVAVGKQLKKDGCENPTASDVENAKSMVVPAKKPKNSVPKRPKIPTPPSLKQVLADVDAARLMVEADKPKPDIIASLTKVAAFIKELLQKEAV